MIYNKLIKKEINIMGRRGLRDTEEEIIKEKRNKRIAALIRRYCEKTNSDYKNYSGELRKKTRMDLWINVIAPYVKSKTSIDLIDMQNKRNLKSCSLKSGSTLIYHVSNNTNLYRQVAKCITDLFNEKRIIFIDICDEYGEEPPREKIEKNKNEKIEFGTEEELREEIKKCYTLIRILNLETYKWCSHRIVILLVNKLASVIKIKEFVKNDVDFENLDERINYAWSLFERELLIRQNINLKYRIEERGHGDIRDYIDFNELPFVISVIVGMLERRNFDCSEILDKAKQHKYSEDISNFKYIYKH